MLVLMDRTSPLLVFGVAAATLVVWFLGLWTLAWACGLDKPWVPAGAISVCTAILMASASLSSSVNWRCYLVVLFLACFVFPIPFTHYVSCGRKCITHIDGSPVFCFVSFLLSILWIAYTSVVAQQNRTNAL